MAVISKQDPPPAVVETVGEIMRLYRSLPPRPTIEEVEAAMSVLKAVNDDEQMKIEEISNQQTPQGVPEDLFSVLQQVRKTMVLFQSHEQSKEARHLIDVDKMFETFDALIQRASGLVSGDTQNDKQTDFVDPVEKIGKKSLISDDSLMKKRGDEESEKHGFKGLMRSSSFKGAFNSVEKIRKENVISDPTLVKKRGYEDSEKNGFKGLVRSSSSKGPFISGEGNNEKLSIMKLAALIENSAKSGAEVLDLKGKLMDQIEWLPVSIGKLSYVTELDLSENQIMSLPSTIGSLKALKKLDLHSNRLVNLPDTFGELINLIDLDLHANRLASLPASFGNLMNLMNLDLSSNDFIHLPDTIGNLNSLKILNVETNELEEIPYTIGNCSLLSELRLDFNKLKALPEAIGKLECLEILTLHYNKIKGLPTTMGNLSNLKELDVSFNELESIPENFCFAASLKKLNVGKNFADLRALPRSIGNLEMLEELDISDDQIRVLPDSFRFLSKLRVFRADETPLEVPPRQIVKSGAQAVVQYMVDLVGKSAAESQLTKKKKKGFWFRVCSTCWPFSGNTTTTSM